MQTTFLGLSMPNALQQLKKMLIGKGFLVQTMPTSDPVILAYQEGNWLRKSKQLVLEIRSVENDLTRVDVTAIIKKDGNSRLEEIIEGKFVTSIRNAFKKVCRKFDS